MSEMNATNPQAIEIVSMQLRTLHNDVVEMKRAVNDMGRQINQLALIEERQAQAAKSMERISLYLEKMDARVTALEQKVPLHDQTTGWVEKAMLTVFGGAIMYLLKLGGVIG